MAGSFSSQPLDPQRKKLSFRAWHRGTREADLLMGRFADAFLAQATDDEIRLFDLLLSENDPDIFDWVSGKETLPQAEFTPLLQKLKDFYRTSS